MNRRFLLFRPGDRQTTSIIHTNYVPYEFDFKKFWNLQNRNTIHLADVTAAVARKIFFIWKINLK